jgi:hypothetical protein
VRAVFLTPSGENGQFAHLRTLKVQGHSDFSFQNQRHFVPGIAARDGAAASTKSVFVRFRHLEIAACSQYFRESRAYRAYHCPFR